MNDKFEAWLAERQVSTPDTPEDEWLGQRKLGVSATDIAAISGLNPYKTIYDVFLEKLDLVEPQPDNPRMRWGRRMEPVLAEDYENMTGFKTLKTGLLRNPENHLVIGTPDRLVIDPENPPKDGRPLKGLEVKTAGIRQKDRWGEPGTDDVPEEYLCQCMWYMAVTGLNEWDLIVSIAGTEPVIYTIRRNDDMIAELVKRAEAFWENNVIPKVPPEVDASEAAKEMLHHFYQKADLDLIESDEKIDRLASALERQRQFREIAESNERYIQNHIKAIIGDHEGVVGEWGMITWKKTRNRTEFNTKRFVSEHPDLAKQYTVTRPGHRVFRVTYKKEDEER
jgi:putative phage-type endonuclease